MTPFRPLCLVIPALLALSATSMAQTAPVMPWATDKPAEKAAPKAEAFGAALALFVTERPDGYGMYQGRPNNHFKPGETLRFYLEPVGYGYKQMGDQYSFGATVDLRLTQNGNTVFSKDGFLNANFLSHHPNKEINFTGSLDVTGAPSGEYNLELVMQDKSSSGVARVVLPFVID